MGLHVSRHPLVQHKLGLLRRADTDSTQFRALVRELTLLLLYEVTSDLPLKRRSADTPLGSTRLPR